MAPPARSHSGDGCHRALSLPPRSFAAGTGLNQTARQVGGALGIATLATLIGSTGAGTAATFEHVYLFCALAALGVAVAGLGLVLRPAPAPTTRRQPAAAYASVTASK